MNTPLISALLPSAAPQPQAAAGAGSAPEGNSFASVLSGQQSQYGATQGSATGSGSQNVSQQNNAPAQSSSNSTMPSGNTPESGAASGSAAQSSSAQATSSQGDQSGQANGSTPSSQGSSSGQTTETANTPGANAGQNNAQNQSTDLAASAAAIEQSQAALAMAAQQAASALLPGLMAPGAATAEAGPTDTLLIDQLDATTDTLSGNALADQGSGAQAGNRNGTTTEFSAFAGLGRAGMASGTAPGSGATAVTAAGTLQGAPGATNLQSKASGTARPDSVAGSAASAAQTAVTSSLPTAAASLSDTSLTPLASALGGMALAGTPGTGQAPGPVAATLTGTTEALGIGMRTKAAFAAGAVSNMAAGIANASSSKWGTSSLSPAHAASESTDTFLNLLSSSRQLFGAPDTQVLQPSDSLVGAQELSNSAAMGLAQASAGALSAASTSGTPGFAVAASVATPLSSPQWGTDFTRTVFNLSQNSNQGPLVAEMRLDPPDLGPIRITLTLHDNVMQAAFVSPHSVVRQTVENALPQLQQLLAQAGISLGDASVNDQGTPGQSEQAGQGSGNGSASGTGGLDTASSGSLGGVGTVAAAEAARGAADPNALVDTFA